MIEILNAENQQLRRLLDDLTKREPRVRNTGARAWVCGVCGCYLDWGDHVGHSPTCAWLQARALLAAHERPPAPPVAGLSRSRP